MVVKRLRKKIISHAVNVETVNRLIAGDYLN